MNSLLDFVAFLRVKWDIMEVHICSNIDVTITNIAVMADLLKYIPYSLTDWVEILCVTSSHQVDSDLVTW